MERFTLKPLTNSMWQVSDSETGFSIKFREGMFNETQDVTQPDKLPEGVDIAIWAAQAMSAIGDYMLENHAEITVCNIYDRRSAIWMLSHESWWKTLAAACSTLAIDEEEGGYTDNLFSQLDYFLVTTGQNPEELEENEKSNLMGAVSLLDDDEALEVFALLDIWSKEYDEDADIDQWARDLLWWPAWANTVIDKMAGMTEDEE
jgi:hypothetical protein